MDALGQRLDLDTEKRLFVSENVEVTLHEFVEDEDIDLIIMAAHGRSAKTRWPYGNTTMSFITRGSSPLLIVQDLDRSALEPTKAELASKEHKGH
jgi:nucleotide-binding universal stress UspA family protein